MSNKEDRKWANAVMKNASKKKNKITSVKSDGGMNISVPVNPSKAHINEAQSILSTREVEFNLPQKEVEFTFEPRKIKGFNIPQKKYELFDFDGKKSKKKQKSKKKLGRSPGALGGKVVNRKKGKTVGGSKIKIKKIKKPVGMSATFPKYVGVTAKKHGGKITYKMSGGQVVDAGYD